MSKTPDYNREAKPDSDDTELDAAAKKAAKEAEAHSIKDVLGMNLAREAANKARTKELEQAAAKKKAKQPSTTDGVIDTAEERRNARLGVGQNKIMPSAKDGLTFAETGVPDALNEIPDAGQQVSRAELATFDTKPAPQTRQDKKRQAKQSGQKSGLLNKALGAGTGLAGIDVLKKAKDLLAKNGKMLDKGAQVQAEADSQARDAMQKQRADNQADAFQTPAQAVSEANADKQLKQQAVKNNEALMAEANTQKGVNVMTATPKTELETKTEKLASLYANYQDTDKTVKKIDKARDRELDYISQAKLLRQREREAQSNHDAKGLADVRQSMREIAAKRINHTSKPTQEQLRELSTISARDALAFGEGKAKTKLERLGAGYTEASETSAKAMLDYRREYQNLTGNDALVTPLGKHSSEKPQLMTPADAKQALEKQQIKVTDADLPFNMVDQKTPVNGDTSTEKKPVMGPDPDPKDVIKFQPSASGLNQAGLETATTEHGSGMQAKTEQTASNDKETELDDAALDHAGNTAESVEARIARLTAELKAAKTERKLNKKLAQQKARSGSDFAKSFKDTRDYLKDVSTKDLVLHTGLRVGKAAIRVSAKVLGAASLAVAGAVGYGAKKAKEMAGNFQSKADESIMNGLPGQNSQLQQGLGK